jgi:hypothetical protein
VGTVRLPMLGLPALWADEGRTGPLAGTSAALAVLTGLALLYRRPDQLRSRSRRGTAVAAAVVLTAVALPGADARFTGSTSSPSVTIPMAAWWNCADVSLATGANATRYWELQESAGPTARNTGNAGSAANGTFSAGGVTYQAAGPACGTGYDHAVRFDGSTGFMRTTETVASPQTFSVQAWFSTTTTLGGKLIGFGDGPNGAPSTAYDRHVYLTNAGQLVFGVGNYVTLTTPAAYNDGRWHLVTATYSAATGMKLYVDRALAMSGPATTLADYTGSWRLGYDNIHAAWAGAPQTGWYAGSMAHVGVFSTVLTDTQVFAQYDMGT